MDIKGRNGLVFDYIQERPRGPHHLVDIFGKLYRDGLTKPLYRPNSNGTIRTSYPHKGLQSPSSNLGYSRKNIDQGQYIYRSGITMKPRLNHILGNSNEDI